MNAKKHRIVCAFFALVFLVSSVLPAPALAAQGDDMPSAALTTEDAEQMQQADEAVATLTDSDAYAQMSQTERQDAAVEQLETLADEGLVVASSIHLDEANGMVSFAYPCGVLGGVLVLDLDEENAGTFALPTFGQGAADAPVKRGSAMIYYAFDNTVNSSRYPYYTYMKTFWTSMGLNTKIDTSVTVLDLSRMGRYDLCILSAHGSYYTYTLGQLLNLTYTEPVILLTEESVLYKDLLYSADLLLHRIIKINGLYAVTPEFFSSSLFAPKMDGTIVLSETCEFLGTDAAPSDAMAEAMLSRGAKAVVGYRNNVYTVYSRSLLWDIVNNLAIGEPIGSAVAHARSAYGENDLIWYREQGGRRPHAAAAYAVLYGDETAKLPFTAGEQQQQQPQQAA